MTVQTQDDLNYGIAQRWCQAQGSDWAILDTAGRGGTAPVFSVQSPEGVLALKLLDEEFSVGERGVETRQRIAIQKERIGRHDCPYLIQVLDGGEFEGRLFLLMNKAEGQELAKCLPLVPRDRIIGLIDQVARACIWLRDKGLSHRDIKSANVFVSHDFKRAVLLDVSVVRDIYDPVGLGTDHGDQLPVVATSRYTPPEYLFRLVDAGPSLWHAVDVYQLGGLIHDMIMREEMFADDYRQSSTNRYRFAWVVATKTPVVTADDVDGSLLLLARRALDKDWRRRSELALEDFLDDHANKMKLGLEAIGLAPKPRPLPKRSPDLRNQLGTLANRLREDIRAHQHELGITASHNVLAGDRDTERVVTFEWVFQDDLHGPLTYRLNYRIAVVSAPDSSKISTLAELSSLKDGKYSGPSVKLTLPDVTFDDSTASVLFSSCIAAVAELASKLLSNRA